MHIALFTLGGTIAMAGRAGTDGGVVTRLTGTDLVDAVPGLADLGVRIEVRDAHAVPSANLTFAQILGVAGAAEQAVTGGAAGVVVTQGTDTLEETAFLVDLVWRPDAPIVFTGAMRNPTLAGADGPANLLAAIRVAAAQPAGGLGALVVVNDEIHAARWVRKAHSTSTGAFTSPDTGPIGQVIEGEVRVLTTPSRRAPVPGWPEPVRLDATRVGLYVATLDDDGALLAHAGELDGLVVAGFGAGHVPSALAAVLGGLAERMPVVLTSRTGAGSVLRDTYGAVGSEADLARRGLINGGLLGPYQARVLLRLLLATGTGPGGVAEIFARYR